MFDIYDPKWHLKCHRSFRPPPWIPVVMLVYTGSYLQVPVAVLILDFWCLWTWWPIPLGACGIILLLTFRCLCHCELITLLKFRCLSVLAYTGSHLQVPVPAHFLFRFAARCERVAEVSVRETGTVCNFCFLLT